MLDRLRTRRPGSSRNRGVVACAGLAALALLIAGCGGGPVTVDAPALSGTAATACKDLVATLPTKVADQEERDVHAGDGYAAAWGDPAIVLTCGVGRPAGYTPGATCISANGFNWYVPDEQIQDDDETVDITMTAVDYDPMVTVRVPGHYRPEGLAATMTDLGSVIARDLPKGKNPCATS